ncbi:MAG: tetratricopeptide repeat protein [Desulfotignum sp.]|nr:tetratricopeptide repeat protein [Desulfotignum sp.]
MNSYFTRPAAFFICVILFFLAGCTSDIEKKEKFLSQADTFIVQQDFNKAIIQLKNAIEIDPKSSRAWEMLTKAYFKLGDAQQGFNSLLKLEQINPDNLDTVIQVASFYLLAQQVKEAKDRVDQVLAKQPEHIPALYLKAAILNRNKENLDNVAGIYEKILALDANQPRAHLALSRIYFARSEHAAAEKSLKNALTLEPENTRLYKTLFGFYLSRNDVASAEAVLEELMTKNPADPDPHIFLGSFYLDRNALEKAETYFLTALKKDPENLSAHMLLANVYNRQNMRSEAEAYIQKALNLEPENHAVINTGAEFYFSHKNFARAREMVDKILAQRPGFLPARILKGKILAEKKEFEGAETIFHTLIQEEPESGRYYYLLGSVLEKKGEISQAKSFLSTAIEKDPGLFQARLLMGNIHLRQKDMDLARTSAQKVLEQMPDNYGASMLLGNVLLATRKIQPARDIFEQLTSLAPDNPSAYFRLGILERSEKNYDKAIKQFTHALTIDPDLMDVFSSLISVYALQNRYDRALQTCDDHLAARGKQNHVIAAVIYNLKAGIYLADNQVEKALDTFEQSILKNPDYAPPYISMARVLIARNRIDDAILACTRLIENRPDQPAAHTLAGTLYEKTNRHDLAQTHYEKALEIDAAHVPALNNLAYLYAEQNRHLNQALELARQAKKLTGQVPAIMDTLGWVYYKKKLYDSAAMEFEAAAGIDPENPVFFYHLGLAYEKLGRAEEAKKALNTALAVQDDFNGADTAKKILEAL